MVYEGVLEGRYVDLKSVTVEDAEFTLDVRTDPELTKYMPRINNTLEQQIEWIKHQQQKADDYFFVVRDKKGIRIGTNSLYDIKGSECESGRLTMRGNAFQSIEAQLLMADFAFDVLQIKNIIAYVQEENEKALRFGRSLGYNAVDKIVDKDGKNMVIQLCSRETYEISRKNIVRMLYR